MEYISIKEASERYKKSLSTIKRIVSKAPRKSLKRANKLNTGKYKLLVSISYLNNYFNVSNEPTDEPLNEPTDDLLKILQKELQSKQSIIDKLLHNQEQFLENERNFQILLERGNQRIELLQQHFDNNRAKEENNEEPLKEQQEPEIIKPQLTENKIPSDRASFNEWLNMFKDTI